MVFNLIMFCKLGTIHFNFLSPAAFLFWAVKFANCMLIRYIIATDVLEQWQLYWFSLLKLISHTVLLLCSCWVHKCTCTCTCVTPKPLCVKDVNVATTQFSEFLYMDVILYFLLGRIGVLMLLSCFLMVLWLKGGDYLQGILQGHCAPLNLINILGFLLNPKYTVGWLQAEWSLDHWCRFYPICAPWTIPTRSKYQKTTWWLAY